MTGAPDPDRPDCHAGILDHALVTAAPINQIGGGRGDDFARLIVAAGISCVIGDPVVARKALAHRVAENFF